MLLDGVEQLINGAAMQPVIEGTLITTDSLNGRRQVFLKSCKAGHGSQAGEVNGLLIVDPIGQWCGVVTLAES